MSEPYIVRAFTVPIRVSRLRSLVSQVARKIRIVQEAVSYDILGHRASTWVILVRRDALATLWRSYVLETVKHFLETYARIVLPHGGYAEELSRLWSTSISGDEEAIRRLRLYLMGLADVIAYVLRYPLYREPIRPSRGSVFGLYTPPLLPLVARVIRVTEEMASQTTEGREPEIEIERLFDVMDTLWGETEERGLESVIRDIVAGMVDEDTSYRLELLFYLAPADTRPGGNASSLLLHLLMVSAGAALLASRIAKNRGDRESLDEPIVRLAGLLHDIGKPVNPENHVDSSVELARGLLEGLLPRELLEIVIELVRTHHTRSSDALRRLEEIISRYQGLFKLSANELHNVLVCSDHSMTGLDRVLGIVLEIARGGIGKDAPAHLSGLLNEVRDRLKNLGETLGDEMGLSYLEALEALLLGRDASRTGRAREAYWRLLRSRDGVALVASASEIVARFLSAMRPSNIDREMNNLLRERWPPRSCISLPQRPRLGVGVVDIGGIQSSLSENFRLRSLAGLSLLVDYLTQAIVPYALTTLGIPLEGIIFAGGGTIQFLTVIEGGEDNTERAIERRVGLIIRHRPLISTALRGVVVRVGVAALEEPLYALNVEKAYERIAAIKIRQGTTSRESLTSSWITGLVAPLARLCDSCGRRPATISFHEERLCVVCAARYRVSRTLGYTLDTNRVGYRGKLVEALTGLKLSEMIPSQGFDPVRLIGDGFGSIAQGNYAVLKGDGNSMGLFMSSSLTATMFFERSIRVDLATKNSLGRLISALLENHDGIAQRIMASLIYGFMYAGGDDLLFLLPARLALPVAALLAYEFSAELGYIASLSIGVVGAPHKHNIWWSIDAANALLEEVSKSKARAESVEALRTLSQISSGGMVAFDYTDGWGLNAARALQRHESLENGRATLQPLPVLGEEFSLVKLLSAVTNTRCPVLSLPESSSQDEGIQKCMSEILRRIAYGNANEVATQAYKSVMKSISRAGGVARRPGDLASVAASLLQELGEARAGGEAAIANLLLILLEAYARRRILPLHDIYLVYKFLRGD